VLHSDFLVPLSRLSFVSGDTCPSLSLWWCHPCKHLYSISVPQANFVSQHTSLYIWFNTSLPGGSKYHTWPLSSDGCSGVLSFCSESVLTRTRSTSSEDEADAISWTFSSSSQSDGGIFFNKCGTRVGRTR